MELLVLTPGTLVQFRVPQCRFHHRVSAWKLLAVPNVFLMHRANLGHKNRIDNYDFSIILVVWVLLLNTVRRFSYCTFQLTFDAGTLRVEPCNKWNKELSTEMFHSYRLHCTMLHNLWRFDFKNATLMENCNCLVEGLWNISHYVMLVDNRKSPIPAWFKVCIFWLSLQCWSIYGSFARNDGKLVPIESWHPSTIWHWVFSKTEWDLRLIWFYTCEPPWWSLKLFLIWP